jgi:predicted dehydrogenase
VTRLRVAVVGAGPMGRLHARTVSRSASRDGDCVLAAIVDRHPARADQLAREHHVAALDDLRHLRDVDAAIVAVPTAAHVETALALAESGLDLLVEKPLARHAAEGMRLVLRAEALGRILQVGHVEWYNPRWRQALAQAGVPRRIRVRRLNPISERGLDIDVVQDLMLHDLDWVTRSLGGEVDSLEATGRGRSAGALDEAEARLHFRSGCLVELIASRVHPGRERWLEIEGSAGTLSLDLLAPEEPGEGACDGLDPLGLQWRAFVEAVATRKSPVNDGRAGVAALGWVERVRAVIGEGAVAGETGEAGGHDSPVRR